ncbi:MAG: thioredoxin family protein [Pseudomonadota bacterium]|nr:thioredoxin family protein [Pseudomonadota bacterium]
MKVELFQSAGCKRCAVARDNLKMVAEEVVPGVQWRVVDAVAEIDYAVEVGVMNLPAVVIDGELAFSSLPTSAQLAHELQRRTGGTSRGR